MPVKPPLCRRRHGFGWEFAHGQPFVLSRKRSSAASEIDFAGRADKFNIAAIIPYLIDIR
ncbi:hypothetical protein Y88_1789 [Novosphingobium nitrogenifigens DSM 19370]|uniref:Uncharacterized protein n=1 Tax=Novosphingobium nitrogenifigens DSM 19370 TaxID=983920 RepID=F1Z3W9_9SPHN|nr:hypothetical protein Y88_1789 [Novosphingobium nitrogenifigens DSM 19370]